jgi:nucleoside-diphosphate kinase
MERTLVMIKPDGVQRRLVGRVIGRLEEKGLRLAGMRMLRLTKAQAEDLYSPHKGKPFYDRLIRFVTASPVVVLAVEGRGAVAIVRKILGATLRPEAAPGSIRGDFALSNTHNIAHGSDAPESAARELAIFFSAGDLCDYHHADEIWVYEEGAKELRP